MDTKPRNEKLEQTIMLQIVNIFNQAKILNITAIVFYLSIFVGNIEITMIQKLQYTPVPGFSWLNLHVIIARETLSGR